ncbi:MAG: glycosyltransferase family 4 protein, partial [Chloroflexia bacterium]
IAHLLAGLAEKHQVDLVSFCDRADWQDGARVLRRYCADIRIVPWKPFSPYSARALLGFFSSTPRSLVDIYSPQMAQTIREQVRKHPYDLVIASQITMAAYRKAFAPLPAILEELELGALSAAADQGAWNLRRMRRWLTWFKLRRYLARLLPHFRACTVASPAEEALLRRAVPGYERIAIVPNCVDGADYAGVAAERRRGQLIFPGALTYQANYDAVRFFLQEIYPRVREQEPEVELTITGRTDGVPWPPCPLPGPVQLTGWVEDVRPWIASSQATVVPLRQGGGTRLKILESLALGTPVVSTSKGAEGLEVEDGRHLLLADTPESFAEAVLALLRDRALWARLSAQGRALVAERYDWPQTLARFRALVEECAR